MNEQPAATGDAIAIMMAIHAALSRDVDRLIVAAQRPGPLAAVVGEHWEFLRDQLHHHHHVEDDGVWPLVRPHLAADPAARALLDTVESQHPDLEKRIIDVDGAMALGAPLPALTALRHTLRQHLTDEERDAVPLMRQHVSAAQWRAFSRQEQRRMGLRGAARFFPWLIDGADDDTRATVLALLPAPLRLLSRTTWLRAHRRRTAALPHV